MELQQSHRLGWKLHMRWEGRHMQVQGRKLPLMVELLMMEKHNNIGVSSSIEVQVGRHKLDESK